MTRIFATLLLLLFSVGLFAQKEKPVVLRAILQSIEKQHDVSFIFLDADVEPFKIVPPPPNEILSNKLDYIRQLTGLTFSFSDTSRITILKPYETATVLMDTLSETLKEVVIKNYLARGITKNSDASVRISTQKFGLLPGLIEAEVLQTLQQLPGVLSVDETISNINVRGGTHDQNLFNWNGIRMFQTGHFFGLVSAFSPQLPQQIDIYKNGTPSFFGEGVSSTVNIATKTPDSTRAGFATNLISSEVFAEFKLGKKSGITVSGRRSLTDWFDSPTYENYSDRIFQNTQVTDLQNNETVKYSADKNFRFYDFSLRYDQQIGTKNHLSISGIGMSNALDVTQTMDDSGAITSKNSSLDQRNFGASVDWNTRWNDRNETSVSAYFSSYDLEATNRSVANNQQLDQQNKVLDTGLKLRNIHKLSENLTLENGYQYNETGISNYDNINNPEYDRKAKTVLRNHALVGQIGWKSLDGKFAIQPGFRFNYFDRFGKIRIEPRLQSSYKVSDAFRLEALLETKSQTSSQIIDLQQDFLGLEKRRWTASNDRDIPIQESLQTSVGATYAKSGWLLTLDAFYKEVKGIPSASQSFQNQLEFVRVNGNYEVLGAELLVQKSFASYFRTWVAYSFNRNEYTFDGLNPQNFPNNFEIVHAFTGAFSYEGNRLKASLGARWYTGKPQTTPLVGQSIPNYGEIGYNDPNNGNLSDYFQANFSASYFWKLSRKAQLNLGVSVLNLFDNRNIINRYYRLNDSNSVERVNTYSLGRTPNLSLKVTF
ncbi:TonB-dependent siderophore receptor [Flavobacterium sp.]|uniref:TonB-dependent receptor plug domain-containing protein n=1 Tax=Flavobacterium sp. TaxID=239 RepID=UPI0012209D7D|nr:TonB-dependent receptor plug domain-containing protein [Flavobacterium sp.]RZJ70926.1 MAG: TonB-dependent receptor [Flavobacterium sp.]